MKPSQNDQEMQQYLALFNGDVEAAIASLRRQSKKPKAKQVVNTNPVVVQIEDVSKQYKLGRQRVGALKNVSLEIREGEFVALTGPSGSGKKAPFSNLLAAWTSRATAV